MRLEAGEHVELGDRETVEAVEAHRVAGHHGVEPAAAARAAGGGAELLAVVLQLLAEVVEQLGRERPAADARRVRLGDADDRVMRFGAMPPPVQAAAAMVFDDVTYG